MSLVMGLVNLVSIPAESDDIVTQVDGSHFSRLARPTMQPSPQHAGPRQDVSCHSCDRVWLRRGLIRECAIRMQVPKCQHSAMCQPISQGESSVGLACVLQDVV